jgi:hypothetical protein
VGTKHVFVERDRGGGLIFWKEKGKKFANKKLMSAGVAVMMSAGVAGR